jgi:hypothetical protein
MTAFNESTYITDIVKWEVNPDYSRKLVTVVASAALKRGQVLAKKTSDGKYYPSVDGASDGTQNAVCILLNDLDITAGAVVPVLFRQAIIAPTYLVWDASYSTQGKKDTAIANLETASGIVTATTV